MKRALYISGSFGLGHINRDLAIARELRRQRPEVEVSWLAAHPATLVLEEAGERLLPEAAQLAVDSEPAESAAEGSELNITKYLVAARRHWARNVEVFLRVAATGTFDVVIGDETYELAGAFIKKPSLKQGPFAVMYDFVGLDATTWSLLERLKVYLMNRLWAGDRELYTSGRDLAIFVGQLEDIPEKRFGWFLPGRRAHARAHYHCVGYILPFDPEAYQDRASVRNKLGYGGEPLVICSIGGTALGKELLELCARAYPFIAAEFPGLRMRLCCGPRLSPDSVSAPPGVEVVGYVPSLYEHFAACDLAIVQGGGTCTLELTALRRPFLYFPREKDCEQEAVAARVARHGAGVRMSYSNTTPARLAEAAIVNLGKAVDCARIPTDGARQAAALISRLLD